MPGRLRQLRPLVRAFSVAIALLAALAVPRAALAHPLGNFTINTYSGIRVSPGQIDLDLVLDEAEIPAFQDRLRLDLDGDGELSQAEIDQAREPECRDLVRSIDVRVGGATVTPILTATGLSFPAGAGGLPTMRLVCEMVVRLDPPITAPTRVSFENRSHSERIGWREIVVQGDGVSIEPIGTPLATTSVSARLTAYPTDMLAQPLNQTSVEFRVAPGGKTLPPLAISDANPLPGAPPARGSTVGPSTGATTPSPPQATIPGGVGSEIPSIFRTADLSPAVVLLALTTAVLLGAGHALTPGHGKTLMAAYLVGTRGTAVHAAGLGLAVTVSHTLGILALAVLVVAAHGVLPPDVVVRYLPALAAVTIVAVGGWMLAAEVSRRLAQRPGRAARAHDHRDHDHAANDHGHAPGEDHTHGGVRHSHAPAPGSAITWRSLFLLGLAGGIIPSTNALLILLGTMATGRPAFGIVLVIAFGLGMAVVLGGVGLALVYARGRLDRLPASSTLGRLSAVLPLVASAVVLAVGIWLTGQALLGRPAL